MKKIFKLTSVIILLLATSTAFAAGGMDQLLASDDPPWPPHLQRPQAEVRGVLDGVFLSKRSC